MRRSRLLLLRGTPELPIGATGHAAWEAHRLRAVRAAHRRPGATPPRPGAETLAEFTQGQPAAFAAVPTAETGTAVILYTSGTTGQPKGAELTHSNMVHNALLGHALFGVHPHDMHLTALPLFHSFGQTVQMNGGFATGATVVLMPRFDAGHGAGADGAGAGHVLRRRPDDVSRAADWRRRPGRHAAIAARLRVAGLRRRGDAGRADAAVRGALRRADRGGLRPVGDQPGRHLQPGGPAPPARLRRAARLGGGGAVVRDDGSAAGAGSRARSRSAATT